MIHRILTCLDGSPAADAALDGSVWLARRLEAKIRLLHVIDVRLLEGPWMTDLVGALGVQPYQAAVPQVRKLLEEKGAMLMEAGRAKAGKFLEDTRVTTGLVVDRIIEEERNFDLVVLGQRGEHAQWTREWLGSTAARVVRRSIKPSLVVPEPFQPCSTILAGYDGSARASQALGVACELAVRLKLPLRMICAAEKGAVDEAETNAREGVRYCEAQGVRVQPVVKTEEPEDAILAEAEAASDPWIVIGSFGRSRVREFLVGSTTAVLLQRSRWPLMLTR